MSLLMEALRKAEAAKRAGQGVDAPTDPGATARAEPATPIETAPATAEPFKYTSSDELLALVPQDDEPLEAPAPPIPDVRQPELRLQDNDDVLDDYLTTSLEADLDEHPAPLPARDRIKVAEQRERAAAASMFDAKAPYDNLVGKRRQRIQILVGALAVVVLVFSGAAWYLLTQMPDKSTVGVNQSVASYNLQKRGFLGEAADGPKTAVTAGAGNTAAAPAVPPAAQNVQTATAQAGNAKAVTAAPNASKAGEVALAVSDPRPNGRNPAGADTATANPGSPPTIPGAPVANAADPATRPAGAVLEITHSNTVSKVQPALQSAYNQLQKGNLSAANDLYQELALRYPNNRDALLGLAAVQLKLGNQDGARTTYARLLKLNPLDALARTGMLQAISTADPAAYEKELLALRQQFPALAALSFALGNHYANSARWHEAQAAYFDALLQARRESADSVNPDYAFNLAISLEQLGQKRAALEYYKQAETLANTVKPGFDPMMLRQRLKELEQPQ
jgi:tetratricopeptide (TPR) repeat protein